MLILLLSAALLNHISAIDPSNPSASQPAAGPSPPSEACHNSFIRSLADAGVKIHPRVERSKANTLCKDEWNAYGSWCDGQSLAEMYEKEKKDILESVQQLDKLADMAVELAAKIHKQISDKKIKIGVFKKSKKSILKQIDEIRKINIQNDLSPASNKCWTKMSQIRGSALCSMCSGRNHEFFQSDKALIDYNTCTSVINECSPFFFQVKLFTSTFQKLSKLVGQYLKTDIKADYDNLAQLVKKFEPSKKLISWLVKDPVKSTDDRDQVLKTISVCNHILNIRKATYVQSFDIAIETNMPLFGALLGGITFIKNLCRSVASSLTRIFGTSPDSTPRVLRTLKPLNPSNWNSDSSRRLSSSIAQDGDPFKTDSQTMMPKQDNMFSSYDGSKGSTLDSQYSDAKPINTTAMFP